MQPLSASSVDIVSAPWILPMTSPPLAEGAVAVAEGRIVDVGKREEVLSRFPQACEKRCQTVLMPGLINGHCHLELSYLGGSPSPSPGAAFTAWIEELLRRRGGSQASREDIVTAAIGTLEEMGRAGTICVADIGNTSIPELAGGDEDRPEVLAMLELLAPTGEAVAAVLASLDNLGEDQAVAAHAPYSTAAEVLVAIKERCRRLRQVFSVHCAESREEVEFVQNGGGDFARFLREKRGGNLAFSFASRGFSGSVAYFHALGLLDSSTLLVHGVHLSEAEVRLVAETGAKLCLCPGSNQFLSVGQAPLQAILAAGLLPALGTDSLASNPSLDLWREMGLLAADHPSVEPYLILAMATQGGALALQRAEDYGSLAPGRTARMLEVDSAALANCTNSMAVSRELVKGGRPPLIRWLDMVPRITKKNECIPW